MKIYTKGVLVRYNNANWTIKRLVEDQNGQTQAILKRGIHKCKVPIEDLQSIDE